jgi:hypothetical protein
MITDIPTWRERRDADRNNDEGKCNEDYKDDELADLRAELARRDAMEADCKYPNCTCIGAGVFKACRRTAVVSEWQAVADDPVGEIGHVETTIYKKLPAGTKLYTRPAAPAPEAPTEPVKRTLGQQVADARAIVAADPGRFRHVILQGGDSLATPATEQAPTKDSGDA